MVETAKIIWADGPSGSPYEPSKPSIRAWGTWLEGVISAFFSTGGRIYQTRTLLYADLTATANTMAWVMEDPTAAYNGIYRKVGATGVGSWVRAGDLPFSFIVASNTGAGTANAIQATTSMPSSSSALVILPVIAANTASPVTVAFNGGPALTIKTNSGNDVVAGGLVAGMQLLGVVSGSTFRLVSDQASASILAAAEAAANAAMAAANGGFVFDTLVAFTGSNVPNVLQFLRTAGYNTVGDGGASTYKRMISSPSVVRPWHKQSADGAWWEVTEETITPLMFGAKRDGVTDDSVAIQAAFDYARGKQVFLPAGVYNATVPLYLRKGTRLFGVGPDEQWNSTGSLGPGFGSNSGSILNFVGIGVGSRWTDIDGGVTDKANFKPALVFAGAGCFAEDLTVRKIDGATEATTDADLWDAAIFVPSVQRCGLRRVNTIGKFQAGVYLDATWSQLNATLIALHPEIEPAGGMIEWVAEECWLRGRWGVKVKGTTRLPASFPGSAFIWSPAGTSDHRWFDNRFEGGDRWYISEPLRLADGGCYYHDAAAPNSAGTGQGHTFLGNSFRTGAKYLILLDRSNNDKFESNYGETNIATLPKAPFAITGNTTFTTLTNDSTDAAFWKDGVEVASVLSGLTSANLIGTSFMMHRTTGRFISTNIQATGTATAQILEFTSTQGDGGIDFYKLSGGVRTLQYRFTGTSLRSNTDATANLGNAGMRFGTVFAATGTINTSDEREKQDIGSIPDEWLDAWADVEWVRYKWKSDAEKKGDAARWHVGLMAQRVEKAFASHGLDAFEIGLLCFDKWEDQYSEPVTDEDGVILSDAMLEMKGGERFGLRYDECFAIEAAYQRRRIDRIEASLRQ